MHFLPAAAIDLAEKQFGVLARFQLRRWCGGDVIDGHVRRGLLLRICRGVYRVAGGAVLPEQKAIAASLRARPRATVTGPFVLGHLRVDGFDPEDPFELLLHPGSTLQNVDVAHRPDPFPGRPLTHVGEARLAAPIDALLESALWRPVVGDRRLRVAYDQMRWRSLLSRDRVERRMAQRGDRDPAVVAFREVFSGAGLASESEGERLLAPILCRLRPLPEPQVWVTPRRRVDWYARSLRYGWEYLGNVDHNYVAQRLADAERDEQLTTEGIRLGYVTAADLRSPTTLLGTIVAALTVRADQLGVAPPTVVAE